MLVIIFDLSIGTTDTICDGNPWRIMSVIFLGWSCQQNLVVLVQDLRWFVSRWRFPYETTILCLILWLLRKGKFIDVILFLLCPNNSSRWWWLLCLLHWLLLLLILLLLLFFHLIRDSAFHTFKHLQVGRLLLDSCLSASDHTRWATVICMQ